MLLEQVERLGAVRRFNLQPEVRCKLTEYVIPWRVGQLHTRQLIDGPAPIEMPFCAETFGRSSILGITADRRRSHRRDTRAG